MPQVNIRLRDLVGEEVGGGAYFSVRRVPDTSVVSGTALVSSDVVSDYLSATGTASVELAQSTTDTHYTLIIAGHGIWNFVVGSTDADAHALAAAYASGGAETPIEPITVIDFPHYADAAARDAAVASPVQGDSAVLLDGPTLSVYTGSAWESVGTPTAITGITGGAGLTATRSGATVVLRVTPNGITAEMIGTGQVNSTEVAENAIGIFHLGTKNEWSTGKVLGVDPGPPSELMWVDAGGSPQGSDFPLTSFGATDRILMRSTGGTLGASSIASVRARILGSGEITAAMLKSTNTGTDGQVPTLDTASGGFTFEDKGSGGGGSGDITGVTAGTGLTGGGQSGSVTLNIDPASLNDIHTGTDNTKPITSAGISDYLDDINTHQRTEYTGYSYETGSPGTQGEVKYTASNKEILINLLTAHSALLGQLNPGDFVRVEQSATVYVEGTIGYKVAASGITGTPWRVILTGTPASNGSFTDESTVKIIAESRLAQAVDSMIEDAAASLDEGNDGTSKTKFISPYVFDHLLDDSGHAATSWTGYKYETANNFLSGSADGDVQRVVLSNPTRTEYYIRPTTADKSTIADHLKKGATLEMLADQQHQS